MGKYLLVVGDDRKRSKLSIHIKVRLSELLDLCAYEYYLCLTALTCFQPSDYLLELFLSFTSETACRS